MDCESDFVTVPETEHFFSTGRLERIFRFLLNSDGIGLHSLFRRLIVLLLPEPGLALSLEV